MLAAIFPALPIAWRLPAVIAAAASDLLDGYLSRSLRTDSALGRWLDPVVDKAFLGSVLLTLVAEARITLAELLLIGLRDLAVAGLAVRRLLSPQHCRYRIQPSLLGKITTAAQFIYLASVMAAQNLATAMFVPTALLSAAAAVGYIRRAASEPPASDASKR